MSTRVFVLLIVLLLFLTGCQTSSDQIESRPVSSAAVSSYDYRILGIINFDNVYGEGYSGLLKAAQEVYPGTTDVIDIVPSPDMGMLTGTAVQRITA